MSGYLSTFRKILQYTIFTSLGLVLFWFALKRISLEELMANLRATDYFLVALSLFAALLGYLSRAFRWKILIEPMGYHPKFRQCYNSLMIGYTANFLLPRIGEVTRCAMLGKKQNIPVDKLLGTVITERAFDLVLLLGLLVTLFVGNYDAFGAFISEQAIKGWDKIAAIITSRWYVPLLAAMAIFVLIYLARRYRRKSLRLGFVRRFYRGMRGIGMGIRTILSLRKKWFFIFHTLFIWFMYWCMTFLALKAMPFTENLTAFDALFVMVMGGIGMAMPVQGGIGAFHTIVMLSLGIYGITAKDAVSFAVLFHESQAIFSILLGIISLILYYFGKDKALSQ